MGLKAIGSVCCVSSVLPYQWSACQLPVKTPEDQSEFGPTGPAGLFIACHCYTSKPLDISSNYKSRPNDSDVLKENLEIWTIEKAGGPVK